MECKIVLGCIDGGIRPEGYVHLTEIYAHRVNCLSIESIGKTFEVHIGWNGMGAMEGGFTVYEHKVKIDCHVQGILSWGDSLVLSRIDDLVYRVIRGPSQTMLIQFADLLEASEVYLRVEGTSGLMGDLLHLWEFEQAGREGKILCEVVSGEGERIYDFWLL